MGRSTEYIAYLNNEIPGKYRYSFIDPGDFNNKRNLKKKKPTMEFFQKLSELVNSNHQVSINVFKKEDKITVLVSSKMLVEDSTKENIKPISLTGKPEEMDKSFFKLITKPVSYE